METEKLVEAIDQLGITILSLKKLDLSIESNAASFKNNLDLILKDLKAGFVETTEEDPWN